MSDRRRLVESILVVVSVVLAGAALYKAYKKPPQVIIAEPDGGRKYGNAYPYVDLSGAQTVLANPPLPEAKGGTNRTTGCPGQALGGDPWGCVSVGGAVSSVSGTGSVSCSPTTGAVSCTSSLPDPVTVPHGGTGDTSLTAHGFVVGEGTSAAAVIATCSNPTFFLLSAPGVDPVCAAIASGTVGAINAGDVNCDQTLTNAGTTYRQCLVNGAFGAPFPASGSGVLNWNGSTTWSFSQGPPVISGVNHGTANTPTTSYATFATYSSTVGTGIVATIDCTGTLQWSFTIAGGTGSQLNWGISQDSTSAPTTVRHLVQNSTPGDTVGGAMVESYSGTSAGSHTYRVLVEEQANLSGGQSSGVTADLLCSQHN